MQRRSLLAGAGAVAMLGGCATYGAQPSAPAAPADGKALAQPADIPVGGGKVFPDQRVVLTQPQQGTIKAFSAICTHQGCTVAEVRDGTINCPCHGSRFHIADGSVASGPASSPLPPVRVVVDAAGVRVS